jgi:hypothetical protein
MKRALPVFILLTALQVSAQKTSQEGKSFYQGALVADANYGIDIYNVHYHYETKTTPVGKYDTYDKAGSKSFSLGAQYGVTNWFGVGLRGKFDNYIVSQDSVTKLTPKVTGFEIGVVTDLHAIRAKHFDLSAGLDLGYSNFVYKANDPSGNELYGSGLWTNVHIVPRVYFGPVGFNIAINFATVQYKNMTFSSTTLNQYINPTWRGSGGGVTFGIQYRFFKPKSSA